MITTQAQMAKARIPASIMDCLMAGRIVMRVSLLRAGQAGDCPQERAFAAAAGAEQDKELPVPNVQGHIIDDRRALIALGNLVQSDGHVLGILEPKKEAMLARSPVTNR